MRGTPEPDESDEGEDAAGREDDREGAASDPGSDEGEGVDREPDYRFTLANERTFLAWLRTALALLAAGIAVLHLVPTFALPATRPLLGGLLALLAGATAAAGVVRWHRVERAVRHGRPLPAQRIPWVLAGGLVVLAVVGTVLAVARGSV